MDEVKASRKRFHLFPAEVMDDEAVYFIEVFPSRDSLTVMGIPGVSYGKYMETVLFEDPSDFPGKGDQFSVGQGHAEEHVGITGVKDLVREGQRLPSIMPRHDEMPFQSQASGLPTDCLKAGFAVVQDINLESFPGEEEGVAALSGPQLEDPGP